MIEDKDFSASFIDRLVAGDRAAFAELVEKTSAKVYGLALRMLNNEQDAEDVLQETFIKAFRALPEFERRSSITTWLYRIAANEALMVIRKRKPIEQSVEIDDEEENVESLPEIVDWRGLPEKELLSAETRKVLQDEIDRLSEPLKMVFILRDVEGFSGNETAKILGIKEDAVKTRLVRARLKLRDGLSGYFRERIGTEVKNG
jgi:RNA polymerase sigma-70 factor (ECF subfamily)